MEVVTSDSDTIHCKVGIRANQAFASEGVDNDGGMKAKKGLCRTIRRSNDYVDGEVRLLQINDTFDERA